MAPKTMNHTKLENQITNYQSAISLYETLLERLSQNAVQNKDLITKWQIDGCLLEVQGTLKSK